MNRKQKTGWFCIILLLLLSTYPVTSTLNTQRMPRFQTPPSLLSLRSSQVQRAQQQGDIELMYPRSTTPVIIEKQGNFTLQVITDTFDHIYAYISTAYEPVVDEFWLTITNIDHDDDTWVLDVSLPSGVPEELYNLTVVVDDNGELLSDSKLRAVSVVDEISDSFSFVHIADLHVGDPRGFTQSIRQTLGWRSIRKCIEEVNLLKPDFVIISGDLVFGQLYPGEYAKEYPKCYAMLQEFDVPTYLAPGNHDGYRRLGEDGLEFWQEYFGPLYYSFDYGDAHCIALNSYDWPPRTRISLGPLVFTWGGSIGDEQLNWFEQDLMDSQDADLKFIFLHHTPLWDTKNNSFLRKSYQNRLDLLDLIDTYEVDMVLAGHEHIDHVHKINDTIFLLTTTPQSSIRVPDGYWGYRLITIEDGNITSYNYKEPKYSIPSYHLDITTKQIGRTTSTTITNDLDIDITAYIQMTLPKAQYTIENGAITLQRENNHLIEYYIETEVLHHNSTTITLTKNTLSNN